MTATQKELTQTNTHTHWQPHYLPYK